MKATGRLRLDRKHSRCDEEYSMVSMATAMMMVRFTDPTHHRHTYDADHLMMSE